MTAPADREFQVMPRGHIRDNVVLANFRGGLRNLVNPETGLKFTEDEIARATQVGSRFWIEADAIDQMGQLEQRRAIYLSDQLRADRASTGWLEGFHATMRGERRLTATGGAGVVRVAGVAGTLVRGFANIPDPAAYQARDGKGNKYQVLVSADVLPGGIVDVVMQAIDGGVATNLQAGEKLTWMTRDPSMNPEATVHTAFTGGTDDESDAELADRVMDGAMFKQAAGNDAHFRAWGRAASNSIEDAFIYPCALNAGSVVVAITQKRGAAAGPLARVPNFATHSTAIAYLTPPGSPVVPPRAFVLVVPIVAEDCIVLAQVSLARGSASGWTDVIPFPSFHATGPAIYQVDSPTEFRILCPGDSTLPGKAQGATVSAPDAPAMMLWDESRSCFELLAVSSVQDLGSSRFLVTVSSAPTTPLAPAVRVSPALARHALVSSAVAAAFDRLGPGELFDVQTDPRGNRCRRFPRMDVERPSRIGPDYPASPGQQTGTIVTVLMDALGATDATVPVTAPGKPSYPTSISDGPRMLVLSGLGIYSL